MAVIPLYTIASGCSDSGELCREVEGRKNNCSSDATSFELDETACILEPRFSSGVNQVNITTDDNISHYSISVDSFYNDSAQDRLVVFKRSTAMPFMLEVNITYYSGSGRKSNMNIAYYYNGKSASYFISRQLQISAWKTYCTIKLNGSWVGVEVKQVFIILLYSNECN